MPDLYWHGLRATRTLRPEVVVVTDSGRERVVAISERDLLRLLSDAALILERRRHAEELNRAQEALLAEIAAGDQAATGGAEHDADQA